MITLDEAREAVADLETATCADPHLRGQIERELLERASVTLRKYFEQVAGKCGLCGVEIVPDPGLCGGCAGDAARTARADS